MKQRIQKVLAAAGVDSRRHVEEMVRQGRVSVNGEVKTRLPILVLPGKDVVAVDGEEVKLREGAGGARRGSGNEYRDRSDFPARAGTLERVGSSS